MTNKQLLLEQFTTKVLSPILVRAREGTARAQVVLNAKVERALKDNQEQANRKAQSSIRQVVSQAPAQIQGQPQPITMVTPATVGANLNKQAVTPKQVKAVVTQSEAEKVKDRVIRQSMDELRKMIRQVVIKR